jgi:hypothetical protein
MEMDQLIRVIDHTEDGKVGFDEFIEMLAGEKTITQIYIKQQIAEFREALALLPINTCLIRG